MGRRSCWRGEVHDGGREVYVGGGEVHVGGQVHV